MSVKESIDCTGLPTDARGLVRLDLARTMVRSASAFRKGQARTVGRQGLFESDFSWAALLSLESVEEFVREGLRLEWRFHCRKHQCLDLLERYGQGIFPWLASFVKDGVLVSLPWCVGDCLLALDTPEARDLVVRLKSAIIEEPGGTCPFPRDAQGELTTHGLYPDHEPAQVQPSALTFQRNYAQRHGGSVNRIRVQPTLEATDILATLDSACRQSDGWPVFFGQEPDRAYHALRMIAVRAREGNDWAVLFEVLEGSSKDHLLDCRYLVSSHRGSGCLESDLVSVELYEDEGASDGEQITVCGSWGGVQVTADMRAELEPERSTAAKTQDMRFSLIVRAYLAENPEFWLPEISRTVACIQLEHPEVVAVSVAFEHILGPAGAEYDPDGIDAQWRKLPSESAVYRSLARAIVARDASAFEPGESNLDWRLHLDAPRPHRRP